MSSFIKPIRVAINIADTLLALYGSDPVLHKDLQPGEQICVVCKGLGAKRWDLPFGLHGDPDKGFPYNHENVAPCSACYNGVQTLCDFCGAAHPKTRTRCECVGAARERQVMADAKEEQRRTHCKRVLLKDYTGECLFDDDADEYVYDFDELDPNHTYFACVASSEYVIPDADTVIEDMQHRCAEEVEDGDTFSILEGGKERLQALLEAWMKTDVTLNTGYFQDRNTIIVTE